MNINLIPWTENSTNLCSGQLFEEIARKWNILDEYKFFVAILIDIDSHKHFKMAAINLTNIIELKPQICFVQLNPDLIPTSMLNNLNNRCATEGSLKFGYCLLIGLEFNKPGDYKDK